MTETNIYKYDFYQVQNLIREQAVFILLDKDPIVRICVKEALQPTVDKIFELICQQPEALNKDYKTLILEEEFLNGKLSEIFSEHSPVKEGHAGKTSNIFTASFNKLNKRIFSKDGDNTSETLLQSEVAKWLEICLAEVICSEERFANHQAILKLLDITEMLHNFYSAFKKDLPPSWIEKEIDQWVKTGPPENLIEGIRTFDRDYLKSYLVRLNNMDHLSKWEFMKEVTRYSDHAMLTNEAMFKSSVLRDKNMDAFITFWDNLQLPILQDMPLILLTPEKLLVIAEALLKNKGHMKSDTAVLGLMLLDNFFESSQRISQRLMFYENAATNLPDQEIARNAELIEQGITLSGQWKQTSPVNYEKMISLLARLVPFSDLQEWVFSYKPREANKYTVPYNAEIQVALTAFNDYLTKNHETLNFENFNIQKFNFMLNLLDEKSNDQENIILLLENLKMHVKSPSFYWDNKFSDGYLSAMRGIATLLAKTNEPQQNAETLWKEMQTVHQGWKVDSNYKNANAESFVLCGIALLFEHPESFPTQESKDVFFDRFLSFVLQQSQNTVIIKDDYLVPCLTLLGFGVNQVETQYKERFETRVIKEIDHLINVIDILAQKNQKLTELAKTLLGRRIEREFPYQRKKMLRIKFHRELAILEDKISLLEE